MWEKVEHEKYEKLKIGLVGLSENSGIGLVSAYLARFMGEVGGLNPALIELKPSGLFDGLTMEKHFRRQGFFSFFDAVMGNDTIRGKKNSVYGVNWGIRLPGPELRSLSPIEQIRLVNNITGNPVICLLPHWKKDKEAACLKSMDLIVLVIDPLPSKLLANHDFLCMIKLLKIPVIYLVNKMNKGVSKKDLINYLKEKRLHFLPFIEEELVYGSEYSSRQLFDLPEARKILDPGFSGLLGEILAYF